MKRVHFLGIGGSGASAIAAIAEAEGFEVTGCDKTPFNEFTTVFKENQLFEGHSAKHLENVDILAITPAILSLDPDNDELREAKEQDIEVLTWQEFMAKYLEKDKFVIAVCGTHGKTTTTAMIGTLLEDAGLDPTVELGGVVNKWGVNYRIGKRKPVLSTSTTLSTEGFFVTEADEFNDNFLVTKPDIAVVTTIEYDHPEYFKDFDAYKKSFKKFLSSTKQTIIANLSDRGIQEVLASQGVTLQGWQAQIIDYSKELVNFEIPVPGIHNKFNASAAYQVGMELGIDPEIIKKSLMNFSGVDRRFSLIGQYKDASVYSDFGHHPTEIKVTLQAAREKFPSQEITVIFQPHMFSRTKALFADFVKVLKDVPVDKIYIMDIFPSRELDTGLVSTKQLVGAINQKNIEYTASEKDVLEKISNTKSDVLFFLGAGETDKLAKSLVASYQSLDS